MITPHLFIPGPTTIPDAVRMAMNLPMEDMRSPEFPKFTLPIFEDLKKVFKMKEKNSTWVKDFHSIGTLTSS